MKLIERIDKLLDDRKLSQKSVEQQVGLGVGRLSKWKGGQGEPTARQALAIAARAAGIPVRRLIRQAIGLDVP